MAVKRKVGGSMGLQLPLFTPTASWTPPDLTALPSWAGAKRIAIDIETRDDQLKQLGIGVRRGGYITGVSFAIEDGPAAYLPIKHSGGDNLDEQQVMRYLRAQCATFAGDIVGANLSYDLDYLWEAGVLMPNVRRFKDVQIAEPLLDELQDSYSLENIAKRHGVPGKDEEELRRAAEAYGVDPKKEMWKLPARFVGRYAEQDVRAPLAILRRQERMIDEQDLWDVYHLECDVLPALVRMRRRGVRVNFEKLERIEQWALSEEAEALAEVHRLTGWQVRVGDVWKTEAIAPALTAIGVTLPKTAEGKSSVRKDVLATIKHPVAERLARARKVNKLRTTFAASVRKYATNGRIHCTFNQIAREDEEGDMQGARYGRLSCVDPNLQQQPARDEFAKQWRDIYEPEEGGLWAAKDYSQQEPRWTTHFAALCELPGARTAAQAYHDDPKLDNHQFMADITGLPRKHAKNIYLGLCYGEGGAKLCRELQLPTRFMLMTGSYRDRAVEYFSDREAAMAAKGEREGRVIEVAGEEGQSVLDQFDQRAPFIRLVAKEAEARAKQRGYIITGDGRRLRFPQKPDGTFDWTHKALNRLIQGTSAGQTKKAVVELDRAGFHMMLQVHDEIDSTVSDEAEAQRGAAIMREVMPALVPFRVDVEIGTSWGASM